MSFTGSDGMEVDRGQMQGNIGEGGLDIHEGSGAKLAEEASAADLANNAGGQEDKGQSTDPANAAAKFQAALKPIIQAYRVSCLNCGAQLHVELPHPSGSFQCCQCHAVHKIIQDTFAMSDQNKKRKRNKDKPPTGKPDDKEPRELSIYNKFIKEHLAALKNDNPGLAHKDAYKQVSAMWSSSPLNPKRVPMGGEISADPSQVGAPAAPSEHHPNAFHYPQEAVHDHHAVAAQEAAAAAAAAAVRPPPPSGGQAIDRPADASAAPEQPPHQPA